MDPRPAVSVILPTCNRPELLRIALRSLAWQRFKDFEVVVVNDGGIDVSPVLKEFADCFAMTSLELASPPQGISIARNTGIRASRGQYLAYLDDDDFFYEQHLEVLYQAMQCSQYKVVYTDGVFAVQDVIDGEYRTVSRSVPLSLDFEPSRLACQNITPIHNVMLEKCCLQRSHAFAPYLLCHEDWDMWQRLGRHYHFRHMPYLTTEYTRRRGGMSLSMLKSEMAASWLFVRRQGMLHSAMPPVYLLEQQAEKAEVFGNASGPCRASVILPVGQAAVLLSNPSALRAFDGLCSRLGDAQLILVGTGEQDMLELCGRLSGQRPQRQPRCIVNACDVGRVLSVNQGAALAEGEWLVLFEPELEPCDGWLDALLGAAERFPAAAAFGGVLESPAGISLGGGKWNSKDELIMNRLRSDYREEGPRVVDCLSGLCLMVRRENFAAVGGLHMSYAPGHYADADLCLRLAQEGGKAMLVPDAVLRWNQKGRQLKQSPAGLVSRRVFWDDWRTTPFAISSFTSGSDWSMRPENVLDMFPSEGRMPSSFELTLPKHLQ